MTPTEEKNDSIRTALRLGECHLVYEKLDGSIRVARGTLNPDLIPAEKRPAQSYGKPTEPKTVNSVPYYDLGKEAWRMFYPENLQVLKVL